MFDLVFLQTDAKKMYKIIKSTPITQHCGTGFIRCGLCGGTANSFKKLSNEPENCERSVDFGDPDLREKVINLTLILASSDSKYVIIYAPNIAIGPTIFIQLGAKRHANS